MRSVIWVDDEMLHGDVPEPDQAFLRAELEPRLQPLSDDEYKYGPAGILHTEAPFSYVLDGEHVYWLVAWDPVLLALRFSPDGAMSWARVPGPTSEDDVEDPRFRLVFGPWEAQLDEHEREWGGYATVPPDLDARWEAAMAHVNKLTGELEAEVTASDEAWEAWQQRCEQSPLWVEEA